MFAKRLYDNRDPDLDKVRAPRVKLLQLHPLQRFSVDHVMAGVLDGYMTLAKGRLVIHHTGGDIVYRIRRTPGTFCCHCRRRLDRGPAAAKHVIDNHAGQKSPDKTNPSGYEVLNAIEGERE